MAAEEMRQVDAVSTPGASRLAVLLYGVTTYAVFQVVFLYLLAFVVGLAPYNVDRGPGITCTSRGTSHRIHAK